MPKRHVGWVVCGLSALCVLTSAGAAHAHIRFDPSGAHKSRYGDDQKPAPCGRENGPRGANVYTYEPGETITIKLQEFVPHPGYFRIAFDDDGDDGFVDPRSIKPVNPSRPCPLNDADQCGKSDFNNNETVLMDNLDPHRAGGAKTYEWKVKLPDVECDNCTLQVIQVMEDIVHGAYNTTRANPDGSLEDVYHQCIDLVLKRKTGTKPMADGGSARDAGSGRAITPGSLDAGTRTARGLETDGEDGEDDDTAQASTDDEDDDEGTDRTATRAKASESGCALAQGADTSAATWLLVALGVLLGRAFRARVSGSRDSAARPRSDCSNES